MCTSTSVIPAASHRNLSLIHISLVKVGREDLMITPELQARIDTVSYTHLDGYKRQGLTRQGKKSNPESVLPSKAVRILTLISIF